MAATVVAVRERLSILSAKDRRPIKGGHGNLLEAGRHKEGPDWMIDLFMLPIPTQVGLLI